MKKIFTGVILLFVFACLPGSAAAQKPRLAVMDLKPQGVEPEIAKNLTDLLTLEMDKLDQYEVISRQDMIDVLNAEAQKQALGCDEPDCFKDVSRMLNARFLLTGTIGKLGNTYLLSLKLIDMDSAKVLRRVNQSLVGKSEELIGSLKAAVFALVAEDRPAGESELTLSMLNQLKIAQRLKIFNINLKGGIESPLGRAEDPDSGLLYIRPTYYVVNLDVGYHVLQWLHLVLSTGMHYSSSDFKVQNKLIWGSDLPGGDQSVETTEAIAIESTVDYKAMRIPFDFLVKFQESNGTFLPFFAAGLGVSYSSFSSDKEKATLIRGAKILNDSVALGDAERAAFESCTPPLSKSAESSVCQQDLTLASDKSSVTGMNLDVVAAAGFDYLFSKHFGVTLEGRYNMVHAFNSDGYEISYTSDRVKYDLSGDTASTADDAESIYKDLFPIKSTYHSVMILGGVMVYF